MKKITLLLVAFLMEALSYGQITATGTWTPLTDTRIIFVANDPAGTDGLNDGGLLADGTTTALGQGVAYTFGGTMMTGDTYNISTLVYNVNSSTIKLTISLWDLNTNQQLAISSTTSLTNGATTTTSATISLSYTATINEAGHSLQLRYVKDSTTSTSYADFNIDQVTATINSGTANNLLSITTWNGTAWNNGAPTSNTDAIITGTYNESADITARSLTTNKLGATTAGTITIPSGYTVTLSGPLNRISGTFSLSNNAKLIQTSDVVNIGEINVKKDSSPMVLYDYTLWSSPVTQSTKYIVNFATGTITSPTMRIYGYNTATNNFDNTGISASSQFVLGKGYAIRAPSNYTSTPTVFTGTFAGVPNNGPITIALDASNQGFNLVGNPYPSPINASTFVTDNSSLIDGTLYFFSHNAKSDGTAYEASSGGTGMQYATWNGTGATAAASGVSGIGQNTSLPSGIIQTGQGFIVKATNAGNLSFTNAMRVGASTNTTNDPFFKIVNTKSATTSIATEKHRLWLDLINANGEGLSQLLVGYVDGATNEVDNLYDGEEFGAPKTSLTSQLNGKSYTIQGRALPFTDTDRVPLAFKAAANGTYTIALSKTDGVFASNQEVFLKDNATGSVTNLKNGRYTFSASAGTAASRFELAYSKVAIEAELNTPIIALKKQGVFQISTNGAILKKIVVFDMQGKQVLQQQDINSTSSSLTGLPAARGLLIVKVTTDNNQTQTIKIIN